MKRIHRKIYMGTVLLALFLIGGCDKILQETPRSSFTPEYFKTTNGALGGITSLYGSLRSVFGSSGWSWGMSVGTDESTWGASGPQSGEVTAHDFSLPGNLPTSNVNPAGMIWGLFPSINTASGVIENGSKAGVASKILAEAYFFRGFYYFLMVQTYGGVPLDLGAGRLKFNTNASQTSVRDSASIVYTKAIFPDLDSAIANLPTTPRTTGAVTKQVAQLIKAKAMLTYAWWLQNPNGIPSYPVEAGSPRTDPNGQTPTYYFQQAYNLAVTVIQNPGVYGLQATYYDVNVATNDRNSEEMLYADHTQQSELYNNASLSYASLTGQDNWASWYQTWNYPTMTSSNKSGTWSSVNSVQRIAAQGYGRPWVRNAPPIEVFTKGFADKTNDSRWDATFQTVYRCNQNEAGITAQLYNANYLPISEGSAVLTFLGADSAGVDYSNSVYKSSVGAGVLPGRADFVISPSAINRLVYPGIWKLGPYRTDNGTGLGSPNAGSTRPFPAIKFSEAFFIAAEAAVKGATTAAVTGTYANDGTARGLINIIRARAGKWRYSNAGQTAYVADNSAAMVAATPATITIDYILDERFREYYGEGYRWYDLARTQTWFTKCATYTICAQSATSGAAYTDHTPITVTRTFPNTGYYLNPIPQGQIDAMPAMTTAQKKAYQNPAYQ